MKEAEYARLDPKKVAVHRLASLIILTLLIYLLVNGWIYDDTRFGGTRLIAIQIIATGFIWFSEDHFMDPILRRSVSYRAVAWVALIGIPIGRELYSAFLRSLA